MDETYQTQIMSDYLKNRETHKPQCTKTRKYPLALLPSVTAANLQKRRILQKFRNHFKKPILAFLKQFRKQLKKHIFNEHLPLSGKKAARGKQ